MCNSELLKIDLKGLGEDVASFEFRLGDNYFEAIDAPEVRKGDVCVTLSVHRTANSYFELNFHIEGEVTVPCDRCLDDMRQPVGTDGKLLARLGEEYSEDDDLVTVDENDGVLDVAWFVYEFIVLDIPIKHVHAPGKCNREMIEMLEEHSATRGGDGNGQDTMDPRWSGLQKLKNNN